MSMGDAVWEKIKLRCPGLEDWDVIRDQSHTHHTLVIALAYGTVGAFVGALFLHDYAMGYALGVALGLLRYIVRERWPLLWFWKKVPSGNSAHTLRVVKWDGTGDVLVPMSRLLPFALTCWWFSIPWWLVVVAQLLHGGEALFYSFCRPLHTLFYGGRGLREDVCK